MMEKVRWCEEPHPLVPSMLLSSLLFLAIQTSVGGSMEQKGTDLKVVCMLLTFVMWGKRQQLPRLCWNNASSSSFTFSLAQLWEALFPHS